MFLVLAYPRCPRKEASKCRKVSKASNVKSKAVDKTS